jgi:hypothetical protein
MAGWSRRFSAVAAAFVVGLAGCRDRAGDELVSTERPAEPAPRVPTQPSFPTQPSTQPGTDGGVVSPHLPGADGGVTPLDDAGIVFGTQGPWPLENALYGMAQGILETPIIATSTDEAQNRWVATHSALYLLRPGETQFRRYASADGLHLQDNPVTYCWNNFREADATCQGTVTGGAVDPGITDIVGGGPNEVFVGYAGDDSGAGDKTDPQRHSGKLDRVRLQADGTLKVDRFDLVAGNHGAEYWHNRTVHRLAYDHFVHPHELYVGTNHGVDRLRPDKYRKPRPGEWFDSANLEWMSDHLHPRVCFHAPCDGTERNQRMGDYKGLSVAPDGDLWVAGKWTAGKIRWDPDMVRWFSRPGSQAFAYAFGDPYPTPPNASGFINEPVFRVPLEGDPVHLTAVSVATNGIVWFASGTLRTTPDAINYGIASWDGRKFTPYDPIADLGMAERGISDLVALPDGRLAVAGFFTGVVLWDPSTGESTRLKVGEHLADPRVFRLEVDRMIEPWALHVSTARGASVLRKLP